MTLRLKLLMRFSTTIALVIFLSSCGNNQGEIEAFEGNAVNIDLPEILQKGKLTILAENSSTSYFIYRGKRMGF